MGETNSSLIPKTDFFQPKPELKPPFLLMGWQWTDISATYLFPVASLSLWCMWIVCFIQIQFTLWYNKKTERTLFKDLRNSKIQIESNSQRKPFFFFFQRSPSSPPLLPFPLCHARKTCIRLYLYKVQLKKNQITITSFLNRWQLFSSLMKSGLQI